MTPKAWETGSDKHPMQRPSKSQVIQAYRHVVEQSGGRVVGQRVFLRETGYSHHLWQGVYWRSWSAFQEDAGFTPNLPTGRIPDEYLLRRFAELAQELRAIPTEPDLILKRKSDPSLPSKAAYRRWGNRDALLAKVMEFCEGTDQYSYVIGLLRDGIPARIERRLKAKNVAGFVYLLRSGKSYKIGHTRALGRRLYELAIQLPQKPDTVHVIETDDPEGIEKYWHERFADRRQGGEWFALNAADISAFKSRSFQ